MNEYLQMLKTNRLTLIMSLPCNDPELCSAAFDAGADAVKVHINISHRASGTQFGTLNEEKPAINEMLFNRKGPIGIVAGGSFEEAEKDLDTVIKMPFSFVSLYTRNAPARLLSYEMPLMAACDCEYTLDEVAQMEAIGAKAVEASIIEGTEYGRRLTVRDLLHYSAIVRRTSLPVVVPTQCRILPCDVAALIRTGVKGLMIGAVVTDRTESGIREAIASFRKAIREA